MTDTIKNGIIKIALSGQVESDTRIVFTYPRPYDPATGTENWLRGIFDPREARNFSTNKVYAFWHGPEGNYYGMIVPSPNDTRNGRLMLTLFVGRNIIRSGAALESVFSALEKSLVQSSPSLADTEGISSVLEELQLVPDRLGMRSNTAGSIGYRAYESSVDLDNFLSNCDQRGYGNFRRILFVPSMCLPPVNGTGYTEITAPIIPFVAPRPKATVQPTQRPSRPAPQPQSPSLAKIIVICIGGVAALYILFAAICGFNAGVVPPFRPDVVTQQKSETGHSSDTVAVTNTRTDSLNMLEADAIYMKTNDIWNKEALKSDRYCTLMDYIISQQIEMIAAEKWFDGREENGFWKQIYSIIVSSPDKMEMMKNAFSASTTGQSVDLETLHKRLSDIVSPVGREAGHANVNTPPPAPQRKDGTRSVKKKQKDASANSQVGKKSSEGTKASQESNKSKKRKRVSGSDN